MGMKTRAFTAASDLIKFANDAANGVIVGKFTIVRDEQSNKYVLFWWA